MQWPETPRLPGGIKPNPPPEGFPAAAEPFRWIRPPGGVADWAPYGIVDGVFSHPGLAFVALKAAGRFTVEEVSRIIEVAFAPMLPMGALVFKGRWRDGLVKWEPTANGRRFAFCGTAPR